MEKDNLIRENFARVVENLSIAAHRSGRTEDSIRLVVVTKGQPAEKIHQAYNAGARLFGENYPEETVQKIGDLRSLTDIQFHMIGHLQSRKTKIMAANFDAMQSLDRLSIAEKLNNELEVLQKQMPVLLEMNVSGEESKHGFPAWNKNHHSDIVRTILSIKNYPYLVIKGLMTMPPLDSDIENTRPYFIRLRELSDFLKMEISEIDWSELSMGTSVDYSAAIEEGATYIRVGNAIMGPRPVKNLVN
jgi:hypothetical protein